jgi:hypothetical protein
MLNREQYEQLIHTFLVSLNDICLHASEEKLQGLPRLQHEIDGCLKELCNPENDAAQALYQAFAYIDFFVDADWQEVMALAYDEYRAVEGA